MKKNFYRNIYFNNGRYEILRLNKYYGSYKDLRLALFDRDILEQVDWDYDAFLEVLDFQKPPNIYKAMILPKFGHESQYIKKIPAEYVLTKDSKKLGIFFDYDLATEVAGFYGAEITIKSAKYIISRNIHGKQTHYGTFYSYEDAVKKRDELNDNGWVK